MRENIEELKCYATMKLFDATLAALDKEEKEPEEELDNE